MSIRGLALAALSILAACAAREQAQEPAPAPAASDARAPACGDGARQGDEACDGDDLAGATCASVVAPSATGELRCSPFCTFDTRGCSPHVACGGTGGEQPGAPWPLLGRCAAHPARGEAGVAAGSSLAWARAGAFLGSPVIGNDGTLYVGTADESGHALSAIASDGTLTWSLPTRPIQAAGALLASDAIVVGEERTPGGEGALLAVGVGGELRWSLSAPGVGDWSSATPGPDGTIYVGCPGGALCGITTDGVLRFRVATGAIAWWSAPAVGRDGVVYALGAGGLHALAPDGRVLWSRSDLGSASSPPPVISAEGTIVAAVAGVGLFALRSDGTSRWERRDPALVARHASLALDDVGVAYLGGDDGLLRAVRPDGVIAWGVDVQGLGPTVLGGDGTVYANDGNVRAYTAAGAALWKVQMHLGGTSSPAIGRDGTLYASGVSLFALSP